MTKKQVKLIAQISAVIFNFLANRKHKKKKIKFTHFKSVYYFNDNYNDDHNDNYIDNYIDKYYRIMSEMSKWLVISNNRFSKPMFERFRFTQTV